MLGVDRRSFIYFLVLRSCFERIEIFNVFVLVLGRFFIKVRVVFFVKEEFGVDFLDDDVLGVYGASIVYECG